MLSDRALVDDIQPQVTICRPTNGVCTCFSAPSNPAHLFNRALVGDTHATPGGLTTSAILRDQSVLYPRSGVFANPLLSQPPITAALLYTSRSPSKVLISKVYGLRCRDVAEHTTTFFQSYRDTQNDHCGALVLGATIARGPNPMAHTFVPVVPNSPTAIPYLGIAVWFVVLMIMGLFILCVSLLD